jgi:Bax protein
MVPRERARGSQFGLARFASIQAAVESYMLNLNTHPEYRHFREIRQRLREGGAPITGLALVDGLVGYSERGLEYVQQVASMIRANELE